jgi:radical SAM protein with 4Fe4S-binding SPASM domain
MDYEIFAKILDQIKAHTDSIYLHVKGEPLLHPDLNRFLDLCYEKGFQVNITTNGMLIQQVKEVLLTKPAVRQINFSLHSAEENLSIQSREEYWKSILSFAKEAMQKTEIFISLRLWNLNEKSELDFLQSINRDLLALIEKEFSWSGQKLEETAWQKGIKLSERVYLNQDYQFIWPDLCLEEVSKTGFCYGLRHQAAILVDGTVLPCCLDSEGVINLGNIKKNTFSEIIESERAIQIIDGFTKRQAVEELCQKCGYRKRFDNPISS